jgi:hypothetical protein
MAFRCSRCLIFQGSGLWYQLLCGGGGGGKVKESFAVSKQLLISYRRVQPQELYFIFTILILLSRSNQYVEGTTDQIFCMSDAGKKREYSETVISYA